MAETQVVTLFVGSDPDSNEAVKVIQNMPFDLRVVKCQVGQCDFETPLLISSWGVCDGLKFNNLVRSSSFSGRQTR